MKLFFASIAVTLAACPPAPVQPSPDADAAPIGSQDASDGAVAACQRAAFLGCPEGTAPNCAVVWTKASAVRDVNFACLATAPTVETLRGCSGGFVRCGR